MTVVTKRCSRCGDIKPLTGFHVHKGRKDGRQSRCKPCQLVQVRPSTDAYRAALVSLREMYREEFKTLLAAERAKRGLV